MSKKLCTLSTGDTVYLYDKSIVAFFNGTRKVLSTSIYNGGYHEDFIAVYNHDAKQGAGMPCEMLADSYIEHMKLISKRLSLEPEKVSGMGTAASMENAVIEGMTYKELTVTAIVTGGIETNGGRVGDHADYYRPVEKPDQFGTINILLFLDSDMPPGTLTRALVTCTEAKTAAIQELLFGSNYSMGLATGSGTDQTIIIANSDSGLYLEDAGKHSKLGELIGKVIIKAVKKALDKQSGLNPARQHDALRRLKRFGVTPARLWEKYSSHFNNLLKPQFLLCAEDLAQQDNMLVYTSLYVHILDQYFWQLLKEKEATAAANEILNILKQNYTVTAVDVKKPDVQNMVEAWCEIFNAIIYKNTAMEEDTVANKKTSL
ncbi:adenosylcobinamide amidohydrolase [Pectinatus frisingensis]|uniref:adenosylcobinamide amidohydrolase n=1 Tax=Pectinatus frisingensis TaxID=865 RepID=UPI0018C7D952|nr:adenosylcobinamide amidohydrolase [Pectinatus frisingensis]